MRAFGYWGAGACGFAAAALLGIWWHIGRRTGDRGQVCLAASVGLWAVSGVVEVAFAGRLARAAELGLDPGAALLRLAAWRSCLSLANSLFILLALPWFRYLPRGLQGLVTGATWPLVVGLPFALALLPTLRQLAGGAPAPLVSELDVYYALLTLGFLGAVLWTSFARRRLPALAALTVACVGMAVGAQALKLGAAPGAQVALAAVFKTCLVMLFFALALSWVRELTETARPVLAAAASLALLPGRRVRLAGLSDGPAPAGEVAPFTLTPALYDLLARFAERRTTEAPDGGWLHIKPKHEARPRRAYDIRDHNEVRRLLHALLDGLYGAGNWARE